MNEDYVEEEHIGKTIINEFLTKTRLNEKQSAHRLYYSNNNKEDQRQVPPNLDNAHLHADEHPAQAEDILQPPGLEQPQPVDTYIHPTESNGKAGGLQAYNLLQSLDSLTVSWRPRSSPWRTLRTRRRRTPWRQSWKTCRYSHGGKEIDKNSLTPEQLQQVVATRWVITQRPSNNGTKDIKCRFCGKGFSQFIRDDTDIQTFAATPSSMAMRLLLTIAIIKQFTVFTTDITNAFLNTPIDEEVIVR
eukprot:5425955-Amphidinium_carterae.2